MDNLNESMNAFLSELTSEQNQEPQKSGQPAEEKEVKTTAPAAETGSDVKASSDEPKEEETQEETAEESAEETEEETDSEDTQSESEEGQRPETIEELAEALGFTTDEMLSHYKYKAKVNGEVQEIPLSELGLGYMRQAAFTQNSMQLADERKAFSSAVDVKTQELAKQFENVSDYLSVAQQILKRDAENVDWAKLRAEDPGEYSALQADFQRRENEIHSLVGQVREEQTKLALVESEKHEASLREWAESEQRMFFEKRPELNEDSKRATFFSGIKTYMANNGYSDQDYVFLNDHRNLLTVEKAMKYDQLMEKANVKTQKVKKLPKILKPNAPISKQEASQKRQSEKAEKLRQSGSVADAADIFLDMITKQR